MQFFIVVWLRQRTKGDTEGEGVIWRVPTRHEGIVKYFGSIDLVSPGSHGVQWRFMLGAREREECNSILSLVVALSRFIGKKERKRKREEDGSSGWAQKKRRKKKRGKNYRKLVAYVQIRSCIIEKRVTLFRDAAATIDVQSFPQTPQSDHCDERLRRVIIQSNESSTRQLSPRSLSSLDRLFLRESSSAELLPTAAP